MRRMLGRPILRPKEASMRRTILLLAVFALGLVSGGAGGGAIGEKVPGSSYGDAGGALEVTNRSVGIPATTIYWVDSNYGGTATANVSRASVSGTLVRPLLELEESVSLAIDSASQRMYVGRGRIEGADLDGRHLAGAVPGAWAFQIALDAGSGKLYWTRIDDIAIQRANVDGSAVQSVVFGADAHGIALDTTHGKLYWTDGTLSAVRRANLDGSAVETVVSGLFGPGPIAIDPGGGKIYFGDSGPIRRVNLDGSGLETLVSTNANGIALDTVAGKLYWTTWSKIQRANLDGTEAETLITGLDTAWGIALEADTTAPVVTRPDLLGASDTGESQTDDVTSSKTLSFTGTAERYSTVTLKRGPSVVGTSTVTAPDGTWSIADTVDGDGTYAYEATATDLTGNTSLPSAALQVTVDTTAPEAPSTPDLAPESDSGGSDSDDVTSETGLTFKGTAEPGSTAELFRGAGLVASGRAAAASGAWELGDDVPGRGTYVYTAASTDVAGNTSTRSAPLSVAVTAPTTQVRMRFYDVGVQFPYAIAAGPDGALWYTNHGSYTIGRITPGGTVTTYVAPGLLNPDLITAGPDGALWFTTFGAYAGTLSRVTTAGAIQTFDGAVVSYVAAITAGPDGAVWFTDGNTIGRITSGGTVTHFSDPGISAPYGITAGSDGALWFTNGGTDTIGRITTGGSVTTYTSPDIGSPRSITAGSDGALWFGDSTVGRIGRITTAGVVTTYDVPGSAPYAITAGPDGALWFANWSTSTIGRITTGGSVTIFDDPGISHPRSITAGPDGTVWFTSTHWVDGDNVGSIGKLTIVDLTPPELPKPDLSAASDSGISDSDDVTADTTLTFAGATETGAAVSLRRGATVVATTTADDTSGAWSLTDSVPGIGSYAYTTAATDAAGNASAPSPVLTVTVATAPSVPPAVTAVPGNGRAFVTFTAPALDGGAAIRHYTVTASPGGHIATGAASPILISGLTNGTSYTFTVSATNLAATGAASSPSAAVVPDEATEDGRLLPLTPQPWPRPPVPDPPHTGTRPPLPLH
jgi:virginiamycin B lyase